MTFVITGSCINDTSCVSVCPVNCIHPAPEDPEYQTAEMLYIDPEACIECGACMDACPVSAIFPAYDLPESLEQFEAINARYFAEPAHKNYEQVANAPVVRQFEGTFTETLKVAIIGSGPSACYAAEDLLSTKGINVSVDMFERLPAPFGLVRYGVAPDHQSTKTVTDLFGSLFRRKNFRLFLNTEIGTDVTHDELVDRYHAVLYASGAANDRQLKIPGEALPGSHTATDFVGWYNGHPDHADHSFNLNTERVVIVGNGNVALDVARLLAVDPQVRERSDMADYAIAALGESPVREVIVLGRRGPAEAAFTTPELMGIMRSAGIDVSITGASLDPAAAPNDIVAQKIETMVEADGRPKSSENRVINFRFFGSPVEILGEDSVTGVRVAKNALVIEDGVTKAVQTDETEVIETGLVLRSVGYRGAKVPWLPYNEERSIIRNSAGRVETVEPVYVTGWIKRGAGGVIGTNRFCAAETVGSLFEDVITGRIPDSATASTDDIADVLPEALDAGAWKKLDRHERTAGRPAGRPRQKVFTIEEMLKVARA